MFCSTVLSLTPPTNQRELDMLTLYLLENSRAIRIEWALRELGLEHETLWVPASPYTLPTLAAGGSARPVPAR